MKASIDDPEWVWTRYREAKELLADIAFYQLPGDIRERIEDFMTVSAMDTCTTFGPDCACNTRR